MPLSCAFWMLLSSAVGCDLPRAGVSACCDVCGAPAAGILRETLMLERCPDWRRRDRAAHDLGRVDARCHPEVVAALVNALRLDRDADVREEAAESLARLAPCVPVAHEALRRAADCDPDHGVRKWSRRALRRLDRRCDGDCQICGPAPAPTAVEIDGPARILTPPIVPQGDPVPPSGPIEVPSPAPAEILPAPLPEASPFSNSPDPSAPALEPPLFEGRRATDEAEGRRATDEADDAGRPESPEPRRSATAEGPARRPRGLFIPFVGRRARMALRRDP